LTPNLGFFVLEKLDDFSAWALAEKDSDRDRPSAVCGLNRDRLGLHGDRSTRGANSLGNFVKLGRSQGKMKDRTIRSRCVVHIFEHFDVVATATAFTAASITDAYRRFVFPRLPSGHLPRLQIILGGGGAKNPELKRMLKIRMDQPCSFLTHDDFGIDNAAKEPLAFAILAHETLLGRPSNVPSATGAKRAVILGKIVPGCLALV